MNMPFDNMNNFQISIIKKIHRLKKPIAYMKNLKSAKICIV